MARAILSSNNYIVLKVRWRCEYVCLSEKQLRESVSWKDLSVAVYEYST